MQAIRIRRNKDGQQNVNDLKEAVKKMPNVDWFHLGGGLVISRYSKVSRCWHQQPCHPDRTIREVLQIALYGDYERKDEIRYHRDKARA